jgi:TRAP-type C4-dicarboxylate transport system permease large subunit
MLLRGHGARGIPRLAYPVLGFALYVLSNVALEMAPELVPVLNEATGEEVLPFDSAWYGIVAVTVFLFGVLLSFLVKLEGSERKGTMLDSAMEAARESLPLLPYLAVAVGLLLFDGIVLQTWLNEGTAPFILPLVMLGLVAYDRWFGRDEGDEDYGSGLWKPFTNATSEASGHVGALLFVMVGSVALGSVVDRAEIMALVPPSLGSTFVTMTLLVMVMVLVGMTMDALGAVILVSATVADIAYTNGIDPIHFWMMVLVAFELGYLTPPVAINHLLARQVIGEAAMVENDPVEGGFFAQYEHILIPMGVMATALILVAYVPLMFYS